MEVDEQKLNPQNINFDDLDLYLTLFLWPTVSNCEKIRDFKDLNNFDSNTYDQAVGAYLKWKTDSFPKIKNNDNATEQHKRLRIEVFALIQKYDPEHPIFEMLAPDEWSTFEY